MKGLLFNKTFYWDNADMSWKVKPITTEKELEIEGYTLCEDEDGKRYYKFTNINSDYNFHLY